jgi:hypothetical protein
VVGVDAEEVRGFINNGYSKRKKTQFLCAAGAGRAAEACAKVKGVGALQLKDDDLQRVGWRAIDLERIRIRVTPRVPRPLQKQNRKG